MQAQAGGEWRRTSPKHSKRDYASQEEQLLVAGDGGNDHATGGMARTGNVDPKWPASSGGTVNLEDLEEPHNNNRGLGEQRMKRKRAYNVGESPRPERMRVIHTRGGYKRRVQRMKRVQRVVQENDKCNGTESMNDARGRATR